MTQLALAPAATYAAALAVATVVAKQMAAEAKAAREKNDTNAHLARNQLSESTRKKKQEMCSDDP